MRWNLVRSTHAMHTTPPTTVEVLDMHALLWHAWKQMISILQICARPCNRRISLHHRPPHHRRSPLPKDTEWVKQEMARERLRQSTVTLLMFWVDRTAMISKAMGRISKSGSAYMLLIWSTTYENMIKYLCLCFQFDVSKLIRSDLFFFPERNHS